MQKLTNAPVYETTKPLTISLCHSHSPLSIQGQTRGATLREVGGRPLSHASHRQPSILIRSCFPFLVPSVPVPPSPAPLLRLPFAVSDFQLQWPWLISTQRNKWDSSYVAVWGLLAFCACWNNFFQYGHTRFMISKGRRARLREPEMSFYLQTSSEGQMSVLFGTNNLLCLLLRLWKSQTGREERGRENRFPVYTTYVGSQSGDNCLYQQL